jgi:hypothetical protein
VDRNDQRIESFRWRHVHHLSIRRAEFPQFDQFAHSRLGRNFRRQRVGGDLDRRSIGLCWPLGADKGVLSVTRATPQPAAAVFRGSRAIVPWRWMPRGACGWDAATPSSSTTRRPTRFVA